MAKQDPTPRIIFTDLIEDDKPQAMAWVKGNALAPYLSGLVKVYETHYGGMLVNAEIFGLLDITFLGSTNFYGMHIHQNGDCSNNFQNTGDHYNPSNASHPNHSGDLLPLLSNQGYSWTAFYDKRFSLPEILGRSVVIHQHSDDFSTQPSGNSGEKIGCGVIRRTNRQRK